MPSSPGASSKTATATTSTSCAAVRTTRTSSTLRTVAQSSTTGSAGYAYTDATIAGLRPGGYLYRIQQYDADGTATPSPVVVYTHRATEGFSIAPNPTSGTTFFSVAAGEAGDRYQVIDVTGRTVLRGRLDGIRTEVDLSILPVGSYHVKLVGSGYELNGQVVVQ